MNDSCRVPTTRPLGVGDQQELGRVLVDGLESPFVGLPVGLAADAVAGSAEVVGGQQSHQGGQVGPEGPAQRHLGAVQVDHGQHVA